MVTTLVAVDSNSLHRMSRLVASVFELLAMALISAHRSFSIVSMSSEMASSFSRVILDTSNFGSIFEPSRSREFGRSFFLGFVISGQWSVVMITL